MVYSIFTDGASRGNPGDGGIGIVIYDNKEIIEKYSEFIGKKTNNEAEYLAMIKGLELLIKNKITKANFFADSEFLVKQMIGKYKVKSPKIIPLYEQAQKLLKQVEVKFMWVPREDNKIADELANKSIDDSKNKKINLSKNFENKINNLELLNNLKLDKAFFGKINCLKIQMNQFDEVYFHMGLLNQKLKKWNWIKVKFSDSELGDIIHVLKKDEAKISFFHSFDNNKTQIWCNKSKEFFTIKIKDVSKKMTIGEYELFRVLLERIIIERNFNI